MSFRENVLVYAGAALVGANLATCQESFREGESSCPGVITETAETPVDEHGRLTAQATLAMMAEGAICGPKGLLNPNILQTKSGWAGLGGGLLVVGGIHFFFSGRRRDEDDFDPRSRGNWEL